MGKAISAADANRNFSHLLRDVREGESFVITTHGKPVAKIVPYTAHDAVASAAKAALLERLRAQTGGPAIGKWTRDELYED
jgi:prevent-host-death family protein